MSETSNWQKRKAEELGMLFEGRTLHRPARIMIAEKALEDAEKNGRREALLAVLRAIPKRLPRHPHSDPMEATETGCDVCEIGILIAEHLREPEQANVEAKQ